MYKIFHNIDGEKTTTLNSDAELIDFMCKIAIENEDYQFSIIGVSDALEYLEAPAQFEWFLPPPRQQFGFLIHPCH